MSKVNFKSRFSNTDYSICGLLFAISSAIGIYCGFTQKKNSTFEYFMGSRSMSVFPISLSILSSFMSAITFLGTPSEIYRFGTQYYMIVLAYFMIIPMAAIIYLPVFYNLRVNTAYEYLGLRFNKYVRTLGSSTFIIQMIIYISIVLYAPSLALSQVTGLSIWFSVISMSVVCTFYTAVGGIKSVVWTDVFQVIIMILSMFAVVFKGAVDVGGWKRVWDATKQGQRLQFFNFDTNPTVKYTIWTLSVGGYFYWASLYAVNQVVVQKFLSVPTLKRAKVTAWVSLPGLSAFHTISTLAGMVLYTKYQKCDPKSQRLIKTNDQIFPLFVMDTLGLTPGLPGLFVAGIFSAALSTVSGVLNSLAAVTLEDIVKAYIRPNISEQCAVKLAKVFVVFYGLLSIGLVALAERFGDVLQAALSSIGLFGGPVLGLFSLGMFFPWANSGGAIMGLLSGLAINFWIGIGSTYSKIKHPRAPIRTDGCFANSSIVHDILNVTVSENDAHADLFEHCKFTNPLLDLYGISYLYFSAVGFIVTLGMGLLVSSFIGFNQPELIDPRLIAPVFDILCPYLPAAIRKKLRFNVGAKYVTSSETGLFSNY